MKAHVWHEVIPVLKRVIYQVTNRLLVRDSRKKINQRFFFNYEKQYVKNSSFVTIGVYEKKVLEYRNLLSA